MEIKGKVIAAYETMAEKYNEFMDDMSKKKSL